MYVIPKVGPTYGRRMLTGVLASCGFHVSEVRVGHVLRRVDPIHHHQRQDRAYRQLNPALYRADYFGGKLHIDQNEKHVMFGVTHVGAIDGYSGKIVAFTTMPIKNNIIYEEIYKSYYIQMQRTTIHAGKQYHSMAYGTSYILIMAKNGI